MSTEFETVIGLEVHVQLGTKTKIFCSCPNVCGNPPNTNICPTCLGLPGALPVLNAHALELATIGSLALGGTIAKKMKFDRKNYFYADLPKGYQISQFDLPLSTGGGIQLSVSSDRFINLTRVHLEEDAGKLLHTAESLDESEYTRIDLNRAGTPLIEIVSEPDFRTAAEAYEYLTILKQTMRYCEVSDCNMEEGSLRCDANISIRPQGETELGTKVEIKNLNSFKAVQSAIEFEIRRQIAATEAGKAEDEIVQETRLWDADREVTRGMRSKEGSHDYRYFPDPDLVVFTVTDEFVEEQRLKLPEIASSISDRYTKEFGIPERDAEILTASKALARYFDEAIRSYSANPKGVANWIITELLREVDNNDPYSTKISPNQFGKLVSLVDDSAINGKQGKEVFAEMVTSGRDPEEIIEEKGMKQISDAGEIESICQQVIDENPGPVEQYKGGKTGTIGFLVGQVMKKSQGAANPKIVNETLSKLLK